MSFLARNGAIAAAFRRTTLRNIRRLSSSTEESNDQLFVKQNLGPWAHAESEEDGTYLHVMNTELGKSASEGKVVQALGHAIKLKSSGQRPTVETYNHLVRACAAAGLPNEARALVADMVLMELKPTTETFNHLLHAERFSDTRSLYEIIDLMKDFEIQPDEAMYGLLIERHAMEMQPEMCLRLLATMARKKIVPNLATVSKTVTLLARSGYPILAADVAFEFEDQGVRRLDTVTWMDCLEGCAQAMNAEAVQRCWDKVVKTRSVYPHEGLCMEVLQTAARHGLPELATDALGILAKLERTFTVKEEHLEPLLEAFTRSQRFKEAFGVLLRMEQRGMHVDRTTTRLLSEKLAEHSKTQGWDFLREVASKEERITTSMFNTMLAASLLQGERGIPVALSLLHGDRSLKVNPDADTCHILLEAAIQLRQQTLSEKAKEMMQERRIKHTAETYELFITLALDNVQLGRAYEQLEEMERASFVPSLRILDTMSKKLVEHKDPRGAQLRAMIRERTGTKRSPIRDSDLPLVVSNEDAAFPPWQ